MTNLTPEQMMADVKRLRKRIARLLAYGEDHFTEAQKEIAESDLAATDRPEYREEG